jgi:hypothetical protein
MNTEKEIEDAAYRIDTIARRLYADDTVSPSFKMGIAPDVKLEIDNARRVLAGVDGLSPLEEEQLDFADRVILEFPRLAVKAIQKAIAFQKMPRSEYEEALNSTHPSF